MASVLEVEDPGANQLALKYCDASDTELRHRFSREARIQLSLKGNDRIMPIVADGLDHDPPFFVMPFAEGGSLGEFPVVTDPRLLERIFLRMIECVEELHRRGLLHRDIKPENFLIMDPRLPVETLVLADLGLAKSSNGTAYTTIDQWGGTPEYAPPESLSEPFKDATPRWDIFTMGKSFYKVATGRHALYVTPSPLVPEPLQQVILRCCRLEQSERYGSLEELREALVAAFELILGRTRTERDAEDLELDREIQKLLKNPEAYARESIVQVYRMVLRTIEVAADECVKALGLGGTIKSGPSVVNGPGDVEGDLQIGLLPGSARITSTVFFRVRGDGRQHLIVSALQPQGGGAWQELFRFPVEAVDHHALSIEAGKQLKRAFVAGLKEFHEQISR
jgi:hypothetical protein